MFFTSFPADLTGLGSLEANCLKVFAGLILFFVLSLQAVSLSLPVVFVVKLLLGGVVGPSHC